MQQSRAAAGGLERKQDLIPNDAPVEAPRVESPGNEPDRIDAGIGQRFQQTAAIRADSRRRPDGLLRVNSDF